MVSKMSKLVKDSPTDPTQVFTSFTNSAGKTFMIHGLSPMLPEQIQNSIKVEWVKKNKPLLECPTYEVMTASGEKEVHQHDETTLEVPGDLDATYDNQNKWREYSQNNAEFQGEYSRRLMKKVFLAVVTPPTDEWRDEMEFTGVTLEPEGSAAERYQFTELEVIQSMQDIADLQVAVLRLAGIIDEAAVDAAKASFRSILKAAVAEASGGEVAEGDLVG